MVSQPFIAMYQEGETLILTPRTDLGESRWMEIREEAAAAVRLLEDESIRYVVLDLKYSAYFGSNALSWFLRLWRPLSRRGGQLLLCHLSEVAQEVLNVARLDDLLAIYPAPDDVPPQFRKGLSHSS
jgi:anti-anti-sigma factor